MQSIWAFIKDYYSKIGINYKVDPIIFVGIHIVATPLFILSVSWLIYRYHNKKDIVFPAIIAVFIFNAANIYLVIFGKHIPWYIFTILALTTLVSGYFSYVKIKKRIRKN